MKIVIAVPVLNEEGVLRGSIATLQRALAAMPQHEFTTIIVDNGSEDGTADIGRSLAEDHPGVRYMRLDRRGKGLAIRSGWAAGQEADAFIFMDADLSTDLAALPELIGALEAGAHVAVGSRYHRGSSVRRTFARKVFSRGYRAVLQTMFGTCVGDAPCGFKAVSAEVAREIVPRVRDDRWFFDTELVIRAERSGYAVKEIPVAWTDFRPEGTRSKVVVRRLVAEYLRQCLRLWAELRGEEAERRRGEVSKEEWRWVFGIAALVMVVTTIPPLFGLWYAGAHGLEWKGVQVLAPGDTAFYLDYIDQAKHGRWLFENRFTTAVMTPTLNVFWLAVGLMAALLGLAPLAAYHLARLLLIPALAASAYAFIARVYPDKMRRIISYGLFMLASGFGAYYALLHDAAGYQWPIDMWVAEANPFLSSLYSPHFIASWALIILTFDLLMRAFETGRTRYGAAAGLSALVLFQFHPFHVPVLYCVPFVYLAAAAIRGRFRRDMGVSYGLFALLSAPAVAYHLSVLRDPLWQAINLLNRTPTPSPIHVAIGFGSLTVLWLFGLRKAKRSGFLFAWVAVQAILIYGPFLFQRRMLEGLFFPLAVLAAQAIVVFAGVFKKWGLPFKIVAGAFLAAFLFLPSTFVSVGRVLDVYSKNEPPIFYWMPDETAALRWLRQNTPADAAVLSGGDTGNGIVGWAHRHVYAGHWAGTPLIERKIADIAVFYGRTDMDRIAFLRENGIDYVYWGPSERAYGAELGAVPYLYPAFVRGDIVIFEVLP